MSLGILLGLTVLSLAAMFGLLFGTCAIERRLFDSEPRMRLVADSQPTTQAATTAAEPALGRVA